MYIRIEGMLKFVVRLLGIVVLSLSYGLANAEDFYLSNVSETTQENAPALVLRFTEAIDPKSDLSNSVSIEPVPSGGTNWVTHGDGREWFLPFVEPATEYTVRVSRSLRSVNRKRISVQGEVGKPGSLEQTVTTRDLKAGAYFASSGRFLVGAIKNGIPITVVNQAEVELDVFRVNDKELNKFITNNVFEGQKEIYVLKQIRQYAELVHTARYSNQARKNQRTTYNLNLDPVLDKNQPGIYVAVLRLPGEYNESFDTRVFSITDIGMHVRKYAQSLTLYTHSISTGKPLPNVNLRLWWQKQSNQAEHELYTKTSQDGSYKLVSNDLPQLVIARQGDQISYLRLDREALDLSAYPNATAYHESFQTFMYGPRDLYRPGETVEINMLLRDFDGLNVKDIPVVASIVDARGERREFTWRQEKNGAYQTSFKLDDNAPTGEWRLEVKVAGQGYARGYSFQVEEFLPETLTLQFYDGDRNKVRYVPKKEFDVPIQADYLYGAPAAGNRADAFVSVSPATNIFPDLKGYYFGDGGLVIGSFPVSEIKLDEAGKGKIKIPDSWQSIKVPMKFVINASVYESGGRPITRRQKVIQLPDYDVLPGIQPQFKDKPASNQTVKFKLLSVDKTGLPVKDNLSVRLLRDHREYFWQYDNSRGWYWSHQSHRYVTGSSSVEMKGEEVVVEFPVEWGAYDLEVISSSGAVSKYHFVTEWSWDEQAVVNLKPDVLKISLDKDRYIPGETAKLRVNSSIAGEAILNVESSEGVIFSQREMVVKGENQLTMNIPKSWKRHDLYVTAMVLTAADQVNEVAPKRALGIVPLRLRREDAVAEVVLKTEDKVEPNKEIKARIEVSNLADLGEQQFYATVALVDKGVLNITRFQTPSPEEYFFRQLRFLGEYYDIYGQIINNLGYDMLHQRFGGDAGEEDLSRGGDKPKSDVQIVSFFSDPVPLNQGQADVTFKLPNFNGKLKWMVVVYGDRSYGSTSSETTVADKIVTKISMPRFLAMADQSQVTFDLHNLSGADQKLKIEVAVEGEVLASGLTQTIELADKEKRVLTVPVVGGDKEGQGEISLTVTNGEDIKVERKWRLGVRSAYPWQSQYQSAVIEPNAIWQPEVDISNLRESTVKGLLTISDRPAINFKEHFDQLLHYPYGCLEQTTSSTYPWLLLDTKLAEKLNITTMVSKQFNREYNEKFRQQQIKVGIDRLQQKQLSNGGFGYWDSTSHEAYWGTVYATELLVDARLQGIAVNEAMMSVALKRLDEYLRGHADDSSSAWTDDNRYYNFSFRSYAAYVLAKAGTANLSQVRRLLNQVTSESDRNDPNNPKLTTDITASGLAWMHLAAAFDLLNDKKNAEEVNQLALQQKRKQYQYYRDYGSQLRDAALSLSVALEHGLSEGSLTSDLIGAMQNSRWFSTQDRIAMAKVSKQYQRSNNLWSASLSFAGTESKISKSQSYTTIFNAEEILNLKQIKAEDSKLYVSLHYHGAPLEPPTPTSEGLKIIRTYYDLQGNTITPKILKSGELIVVGLDVQGIEGSDVRIPEALVVELLPAGLELENQNLGNAGVKLDDILIEGKPLLEYYNDEPADYQEYRDDRYIAAISVDPWSSVRLYYLARAVTPGTYHVAPPYVEDMYRPVYRASGSSIKKMTVLPR
jgi:uncharacterized protein YfaS (alpha-2-macroglobulin family)